MEQATTIGLDIAKHVFQLHGADGAGHVLFRKRITRARSFSVSYQRKPGASWRWKPVLVRTTGRVRSLS
jgi:transposase